MTAPLCIAEIVSRPMTLAGAVELDARQQGRARGQRVEPELEPGGDGATEVATVGGHDVERRRRAQVDDDGRHPVQATGGEGVDDAVGTRVGWSVDPDRDGHGLRARLEERDAAAGCDLRGGRRPGRDDAGHHDGLDDGLERPVLEPQQPPEQRLERVRGDGTW